VRSAFVGIAVVRAGAAWAEPPTPPDSSATLPTPYTAEQIRDVWRPGFRVEMRTTEAGVVSSQRMSVLSATPEACTIRVEALGAHGEGAAPPRESTAKWSELRDHALFSAANTTRERAECRAPLGAMAGWRYVVAREHGETLTMCFADAAPGPPVEFETARGGEVVSRTEHTSYERVTNGAEEKR
jgi:hypothetical protein